MKDKKFLEGLAHDKRYLEHIVGQLSISATTRNSNPETNSTTRLMLSEVNKLILIAIISYITRLFYGNPICTISSISIFRLKRV